eukprot:TRINITY_DN387_c0_g2_i1.p1 TRINITY_DN387_c0_g2~~TRINITY_DN387_c0_g2_i1.p1  ORF type:complete len:276 (-),score=38.06 TRINITY_DN387_c0_g2_i1:103-930(-)
MNPASLLVCAINFAIVWGITIGEGGDYPDIKSAFQNSSDGDVLYLQSGTFSGINNTNLNLSGKDISLVGNETVIDCLGSLESPTRFFYLQGGYENNTLFLSKMTVQNCNVLEGGDDLLDKGGAIYISSNYSSLVVDDVIFLNNSAIYGGAIFVEGGRLTNQNNSGTPAQLTITGSQFENNYAELGGAIYANNGLLSVQTTEFTRNSANEGGGIYALRSPGTYVSTEFKNNSATDAGGALSLQTSSRGIFTNCLFESNSAEGDGGAWNCEGNCLLP